MRIALICVLLVACSGLGGCALVAAGVTGAVIATELDHRNDWAPQPYARPGYRWLCNPYSCYWQQAY